jgi:hypothetical protein
MWREIAQIIFLIGFFLSFPATILLVYVSSRLRLSTEVDLRKTAEEVLSDPEEAIERGRKRRKVLRILIAIWGLSWVLMAVGLVVRLTQGG